MKNDKLHSLLEEYDGLMTEVRDVRKVIKAAETNNKEKQERVAEIKKELYTIVKPELEEGTTLYRIAMDNFGRIDKHFHVLFSIFNKSKTYADI